MRMWMSMNMMMEIMKERDLLECSHFSCGGTIIDDVFLIYCRAGERRTMTEKKATQCAIWIKTMCPSVRRGCAHGALTPSRLPYPPRARSRLPIPPGFRVAFPFPSRHSNRSHTELLQHAPYLPELNRCHGAD